MPWTARIGIILLALLLSAGIADGNVIMLQSAVRLSDDSMTVRLRDIAELQGAEARKLGDLIITELADRAKAVEIPLRDIRAKLDAAGVHWGKVNLCGRDVVVRPRPTGAAGPVLPMTPVSLNGAARETDSQSPGEHEPVIAVSLMNEPTLRGASVRFIAANLRVDPQALRLAFDDRQDELLAMREDEVRFEIQPASSLASPRIDLAVRLWQEGRIIDRHTVNVSPLVLQTVVVAREGIDRNQAIRESDLEVKEEWLPPHQPTVVTSVHEAVGRFAVVRLREGELIRTTQLRQEMLVERGEQVIVRCLVGGSVISLQAEARSDGADGETIEFRKLGERETFLATVTGRKEATLNLSR